MVKKIVIAFVLSIITIAAVNAAAPAPKSWGDTCKEVKDTVVKGATYIKTNPKICLAGAVALVAGIDAVPHIAGNLIIAPFQALGLGSPSAEDQSTAKVITAMYAGLAWYYWPQLKQAYARFQGMAAQ